MPWLINRFSMLNFDVIDVKICGNFQLTKVIVFFRPRFKDQTHIGDHNFMPDPDNIPHEYNKGYTLSDKIMLSVIVIFFFVAILWFVSTSMLAGTFSKLADGTLAGEIVGPYRISHQPFFRRRYQSQPRLLRSQFSPNLRLLRQDPPGIRIPIEYARLLV